MKLREIVTIERVLIIIACCLIIISWCLISAMPTNGKYDRVPVCKGLKIRKDEIKNNPDQFLKDALIAINKASTNHQCHNMV
jgi:hypothetical protein